MESFKFPCTGSFDFGRFDYSGIGRFDLYDTKAKTYTEFRPIRFVVATGSFNLWGYSTCGDRKL